MTHQSRFRCLVQSNPIVSNCIFSLGSWTLGDILIQTVEHAYSAKNVYVDENVSADDSKRIQAHTQPHHWNNNNKEDETALPIASSFQWDRQRTLHMCSFGALVNGPILALWYPWLDRTVNAHVFKYITTTTRWTRPLLKVALECVLFDVPFLTLFFTYMNMVEGGSISCLCDKLKSQLVPSLYACLVVWPAVQLLNFRFMPIVYQPFVVNTVSVFWDGFMSHQNHNTVLIKEEAENRGFMKKEEEE